MTEGVIIDNSSKKGHILMIGSMVLTLVFPLMMIILSYDGIGIISGSASYISAAAVFASAIYIVGGGVWMFIQDKKDGENLTNG